MKEEILRIENVTQEIDGVVYLNNINLNIFKGEIMGLISLSSLGKNHLIRLMCRNIPISYGRIYFNNILVNNYEHSDLDSNKVYVIEQKSKLVEDLTVADNIFVLKKGFGQYVINRSLLNLQVERLFKEIDIDIELSGTVSGMRPLQKCVVELLKAVVAGCGLIVLHEISSFLSPIELEKFQKLMFHFRQQNIAFLYIGNHHEEVFPVCNRVALLDNGKIIRILDQKDLTQEKINPYIISFDIPKSEMQTVKEQSILEYRDIYTENLKGLNLAVKKGECAVILDLSNTALEDMVNILAGRSRQWAGDIIWDNQLFTRKMAKKPFDNGIILIDNHPVQSNLFMHLSYLENLCFLTDKRVKAFRHTSVLKSVEKEYEPLVGEVIHAADIRSLDQKDLYSLVYLRVHLYHPKIVFCVQPFSSADMYLRRHILSLIEMLKAKGITVVILTVSLADSLDVADRLLIAEKGRITKEYGKDEFDSIRTVLK